MTKPTETVLAYHNRTKHSLERYAKGPESIDWEDQPDQFRRFSGCEIVTLPLPGTELEPLFTDLDNPETIAAKPLNLANAGLLLELAFGLSAWKQFGPSRWALRCNPSSGNLHPTEAYLISTGNDFIKAGVYHYVSHDHHLEQRCRFSDNFADSALLIGFSSIHWREAWKYGERAYRYCQHDLGHALGALRYAAATLGWSVELQAEWSDDDIAKLLGLDRDDFKKQEHESPDIICRINTRSGAMPVDIESLLESAQSGTWSGKADSLRAYHMYKWPVIDEVSIAASKPQTEEPAWKAARQPVIKSSCIQTATKIIRQRRSAQHFDGKMRPMPLGDFYRMLSAVLPGSAAFEFWRWPAKIHLFIFVHRIEGLDPGIYALPRHNDALEPLQTATLTDFDWRPVSEDLPLYHLYSGDCRQIAKTLSCHQPIASDSAFSLGMVAEFGETVQTAPWLYRRLFWECGLIGQTLYLEAEAAGLRGTGIGCYFDDSVHELLGIKDEQFQSLYHFTMGKPLEDSRLETLAGYGHLGGVR
ncbi:SagB/ThcOx family dehydrogenase [Candidatus Methylobacter oryzae]|uniref:SagB/ThcOx family dehydrogenase n=1 Tax=Candidatus Methylobacter oryzae TaxID=2497749 RepID=A0ABY3CAH0_9GAMM|nr:SagB/ThcOx family dehydrogenase [Candidatus Methylobacter oryzae]TRW93225.1 SagB/ThcOx family dehydrogenase [Candidatus Methylobacter oryzae]